MAETTSRYTVVYEGDPVGPKILSGEIAPGKAVAVMAGDLVAEAGRSEKHRNDLSDELVRLKIERGALRSRVDSLENVLRNARHMVHGGAAISSTADMLRLLAGLAERGGPLPTASEVGERIALLEAAGTAMHSALYPA